jgi:hypothetical protein
MSSLRWEPMVRSIYCRTGPIFIPGSNNRPGGSSPTCSINGAVLCNEPGNEVSDPHMHTPIGDNDDQISVQSH